MSEIFRDESAVIDATQFVYYENDDVITTYANALNKVLGKTVLHSIRIIKLALGTLLTFLA